MAVAVQHSQSRKLLQTAIGNPFVQVCSKCGNKGMEGREGMEGHVTRDGHQCYALRFGKNCRKVRGTEGGQVLIARS